MAQKSGKKPSTQKRELLHLEHKTVHFTCSTASGVRTQSGANGQLREESFWEDALP
jgi:hypothetical protein